MEKVKIASAIEKESKAGKKYLTITTEDGRTGMSYDLELKDKLNIEIELDVKEGKPYNDVPQYFFNVIKEKTGGGGFPKKDYSFEKKRVALECASRLFQGHIEERGESVLEVAKIFHQYLNS